jgi:hypothetical protein
MTWKEENPYHDQQGICQTIQCTTFQLFADYGFPLAAFSGYGMSVILTDEKNKQFSNVLP